MDAVSATRCPGCGRTVSNQLITCPGCGTPVGYRAAPAGSAGVPIAADFLAHSDGDVDVCPGCGRPVGRGFATCGVCAVPVRFGRSENTAGWAGLIPEAGPEDGPHVFSLGNFLAGLAMTLLPGIVTSSFFLGAISEGEMWAALFALAAGNIGDNGTWIAGLTAYVGAFGLAAAAQEVALGFGLIERRWGDFLAVVTALTAVTDRIESRGWTRYD